MGRLRLEREHELKRLALDGDARAGPSRGRTPRTQPRCWSWSGERMRATIDNEQSPANIQAKLIDSLPEIVAKLPKPAELRSVTIGGNDSTTVAGLLAELSTVVSALRSVVPPTP